MAELGNAGVDGHIHTWAAMTVFAFLLVGFTCRAAMAVRAGMSVIGALIVKSRLEFDMTIGAETQNCALH